MIKISLHHIMLFGHHGIHPEEKITGGEFEVNMDVSYVPDQTIMDISQTIDYTILYDIILQRMKKPADLLETLVQDIDREVRERFPQARQINITISKIHAPLINFRGRLGVSQIND
jgi:7,8-dihydroneopterin aldolase/epimerase/oxygenase